MEGSHRFVTETVHNVVLHSIFLFIFLLRTYYVCNTALNTVISPNFLMLRFCGKAQFPYSFGQSTRNCAKTVPFLKISTPENLVKLRYFTQCNSHT